jgi:two-component system cell cycle sensor histidine kinase/response regulator CckA
MIKSMELMLRRLMGEDVVLATHLATPLAAVKADPGQIEQVLMNLVVNARDSMPKGGKLSIETANADLDETFAALHFPMPPGRYVMLAVSDNGCGMNAETRARVFEPFFTTKEVGKGTGLGLSTVYGIVKQSGGYIWVESEVGQGTTFRIYLPPAESIVEVSQPAARLGPEVSVSETVLLVEDEAGVRELARRVLESSGFRVLLARDGQEALLAAIQLKVLLPALVIAT